jgi:hypothetical protein
MDKVNMDFDRLNLGDDDDDSGDDGEYVDLVAQE